MRRSGRRGFTLIELLVVVAIILLLVGILLPTFGWIDRLTKNAHCQKNLREIGKVMDAYCTMNKGRYPYPLTTYSGVYFQGATVPQNLWAGLAQVMQLKQAGAGPDIFFCPFDPNYGDWDAWPADTWKTPYVPSWKPSVVRVYTGYTLLIYRGHGMASVKFADGRRPIGNDTGDDDLPIVADNLHARPSTPSFHYGISWLHGGGVPDGVFNSGCNTLFMDGHVVHMDAGEFDWNQPTIVVGSCHDLWWFALSR